MFGRSKKYGLAWRYQLQHQPFPASANVKFGCR